MDRVWEFRGADDRLIEHRHDPRAMTVPTTMCGKTEGEPDWDSWFTEHERTEAVVLCGDCLTRSERAAILAMRGYEGIPPLEARP